MPVARLVCAEPEDVVADFLRRIGLPGDAVEYSVDRIGHYQVLLTGAGREGLKQLRSLFQNASAPGTEEFPHVVLGDKERAMGTAFLSGRRDQLERLSRTLIAGEGTHPEGALIGRAVMNALERNRQAPAPTTIGGTKFVWGTRTFIMGVVNVTPDSFSDGGRFLSADEAVAQGERLAAEGADVLDIGGESTRPGAEPTSAEEQLRRVLPVIERLAKSVKVPLSIDTTNADVAEAAVRAGASMVNDISGFKFDLRMAGALGRLQVPACAMHIQGTPQTMQLTPTYFDVVGEVMEHLAVSTDHALAAGLPREMLLVDPGIGFGKTDGHNLFLLRHLKQMKALGFPILVGASRKGTLGRLTGRKVDERVSASVAAVTTAIFNGADMVRVHDVAASVDAAKVADAVARAHEGGFAFLGM